MKAFPYKSDFYCLSTRLSSFVSCLSRRKEEKSLRKIYFDDTAPCREKDAVRVNFLQSGGTWMIVLAVINIKGFLLS